MTRLTPLATGAFFAASALPALAQDDPFLLDTIIVSGGFTPVQAARYGRAVSVVTADEIAARGLTTVTEVLRTVPGLSVSSTGGNSTQVRIRGGEANHTLILIDGIEAAGGDGEYVLSGLEAGNIERIEVLRGPQSVFYGSNASSGVINIITRKGADGSQVRTSFAAGGGLVASVFASRRGERGGVSVGFDFLDDFGWDYSGDGGEKDETLRRTLTFAADYALTEDFRLGLTFRRASEDYDFDGNSYTATDAAGYVVDDPTQAGTREEETIGVWAEYAMAGGRLTHRLSYEVTANEDVYFPGATPIDTRTTALKYRLSYGLDGQPAEVSDQVVNLFVERATDSSSSDARYARSANSYALEYRGSFASGLDLQAGVRFDDNAVFDDVTTWTAAASYTFTNGVRLHASAGTGSVNPSYFELYADAYGYTGNPDLSPERNRSFDAGVELPLMGDRGTVDVTYFNETLVDEITDIYTGTGFTYENQTGESTRRGVEVSGTLAVTDMLDLRLGYTWLDARNPDGSVEVRRPKHELILGATLETFGGRGSVSADLRRVAGNFDTQFWGSYATTELPAYTVVDIAATYEITATVKLQARVENLFDADAMDVWGYPGRPRTIYAGLGATF